MATPNTKDDSKVVDENALDQTTSIANGEVLTEEIDHGYLAASKTTKFYRGVLFQMILFGA
jgi:hypothetical protein